LKKHHKNEEWGIDSQGCSIISGSHGSGPDFLGSVIFCPNVNREALIPAKENPDFGSYKNDLFSSDS
jgi:hypothetical protein